MYTFNVVNEIRTCSSSFNTYWDILLVVLVCRSCEPFGTLFLNLLRCWMPNIRKQKIGLALGCYLSDRTYRSISVVVWCLVDSIDFCAIKYLVSLGCCWVNFFQELVWILDVYKAIRSWRITSNVRLGRLNTNHRTWFRTRTRKGCCLEYPWPKRA